MDTEHYWALIAEARARAADPSDAEAVAAEASALLADYPREEIVATLQVFWDLMADSYRNPLWAAAYLINGGCSDDGFDYFRGWLVAQGREVFERVVHDPDTLADVPTIIAVAPDRDEVECEDVLAIVWNAHLKSTGEQPPPGAATIRYPELDPAWGFDFDDETEMARRLPRLSALYAN